MTDENLFENETDDIFVCMLHYCFIPCRRCEDDSGAFWSNRPQDIEFVKNYQEAGR